MLISETKYRHQVEEDIRPFRDLLLGLFFITTGMRLDLSLVWEQWFFVLLLFIFLTIGKAGIIAGLTRLFKVSPGTATRTGLALAQGGEFGFVLLALASASHLLDAATEQIALAAILLSMLAAPFLIQQSETIIRRFIGSDWMLQAMQITQLAARTMTLSDHVILCGYGRSGQTLANVLLQANIQVHGLDVDPDRVAEASAAGEYVSFGDATRREVLLSAGLARARALVVTYDHTPSALKILSIVSEEHPNLPVVVRTWDGNDLQVLRAAGADEVVADMLEGSLMLASHTMLLLGVPINQVIRRARKARESSYSLYNAFFHGASDDVDIEDQAHPRLHTVQINQKAAASGHLLAELKLDEINVVVRTIKRAGKRIDLPTSEERLQSDDVLVLLGVPEQLTIAERRILRGK